MISESVDILLSTCAAAIRKRDRRDHHHQQRNDQPGDADEHQDGLALAGHDVEVVQRLRDPDHGGQAAQHHHEGVERRAKYVAVDRPHPPPSSPYMPRWSDPRPVGRPRSERCCYDPTPVGLPLDPFTNGLAKAKSLNTHNKKRENMANEGLIPGSSLAGAPGPRFWQAGTALAPVKTAKNGPIRLCSGAGGGAYGAGAEPRPEPRGLRQSKDLLMPDALKLGFGAVRRSRQGRPGRILRR